MSHIRFAGIAIAIVVFAWAWWRRSRRRGTRGEALLLVVLGLGLAVLSIFPALARPLAWLFNVESSLTAALVLTSIALVFGLAIERSRRRAIERELGDLVRNLALRESIVAEPATGPLISVVIPAYNEATAITGVLRELPDQLAGLSIEPVVVVDGGDDGTEAVVRREGYVVVAHPINRGQGDALRTGFAFAMRRRATVVMTMDADGQHRPDEMELLVRPVLDGRADYVQGSRYLGHYDDAGSTRDRGIRIFTRVINRLAGTTITDCTNGFRAIRGDELGRLELVEDRFSAPELIIESAQRGLRVAEVPVHIRARTQGESKKPPRLGYPVGFLRAALRTWLRWT